MKKFLSIFILLALFGCATNDKIIIYGDNRSAYYVVAQVCFKDNKVEINNRLRYSILFNKNNYIKFLDTPQKMNKHLFFDLALGEKRNLAGFILPLEYEKNQNFGFVWDLKKSSSVSASKWTLWQEPQYTVEDISDIDFKKDNGLIGKKDKDESTVSPYLVRFRTLGVEEYISARIDKWKKDPVPVCVADKLI